MRGFHSNKLQSSHCCAHSENRICSLLFSTTHTIASWVSALNTSSLSTQLRAIAHTGPSMQWVFYPPCPIASRYNRPAQSHNPRIHLGQSASHPTYSVWGKAYANSFRTAVQKLKKHHERWVCIEMLDNCEHNWILTGEVVFLLRACFSYSSCTQAGLLPNTLCCAACCNKPQKCNIYHS